ncbi:hypothetical protein FXO38_16632 [Capsicum annuum]|nr:hypothetical protein FXO38_16632 [Capsicum annuum]
MILAVRVLQVIEQILESEIAEPSKIKRVRQKKTRILDVKTTLLKHNASLNEVTTYEKAHSCSVDFIASDHRNATSKVIYDYILELVHDSSNVITPNFMVDEMRKKYGIIISYNKGWRAIQHAYTVIRGTAEENYNRLSSYLHMMKENNPSTYINIKRDDENREASTYNDEGRKGKVLIIDMVLNRDEDEANMTEVKLLFDVLMIVLLACGGGGRAENCERMEKAIP